ncbi:MAG TPA: hypothetical protein VKU77_31385 [Streptosporangiaceae bacterium]|nr:hypothetical protein [Streptosporangiaceae bacterium]
MVLVRSVWRADVELRLREARFEIAEHGTHTELVDRGGLYVDGCDWGRESGCGRWRA